MSVSTAAPVVNRLIDGLPRAEHAALLIGCEPIKLTAGDILCEPHQPFAYAYFPLTSFISLMQVSADHSPLEMGLIGNEGLCGATLALGIDTLPLRAIVQGGGTALRLTVAQLRHAMATSPVLMKRLRAYQYVLSAQSFTSTACIHSHEIEPRLARWLLMIHDRAHGDPFYLTQEFLAGMLGVRQSGITEAAGALQSRKLIHYSRGKITVLDRRGLEAAACACYAITVRDYVGWL